MKKLYLALFVLSLIWGTSFLFIKILVSPMSIWEVVFWRCTFGSVVLWALYLWKGKGNLLQLPWLPLLLIGLTNNTLPWGLIALSETKISSSLASVLNATTPIWTALIGVTIFSTYMQRKQWGGILIGFVGIVILVDVNGSEILSGEVVGVATMIMAAMCYGFSSQYIKRHVNHVPSLIVAAVTLSFSAVYAFIFAQINGTINWSLVKNFDIFSSLIGLGAFGSGVGIYIFYYLIQKGSAEFATMVTYLVPISAMLWGALFLGEVITITMVVGLFFVLLGVYMAQERKKSKRGMQHEQQTRVS